MKKVIVTGADGQLGRCIQKVTKEYPELDFVFVNSRQLDITGIKKVNAVFTSEPFDYCINCAAYTNVDQAERIPERAYKVNAEGVRNLALACKENNAVLIHISTDYVFDGEKETPYTIKDIPNPINEYGKSKLMGEKYIQEVLDKYHIIRTSWLYSEFGKNFYKTIIEKAKSEKVLYVTDQQKGCPTKADNLAAFILNDIILNHFKFGLYHFTDKKVMTWYRFAEKILKENDLIDNVSLVKAKNYRTFAKRPKNSILL